MYYYIEIFYNYQEFLSFLEPFLHRFLQKKRKFPDNIPGISI